MSRSATTAGGRGRKKSRASLIWIVVAVLLVIVLLYLEQVALLYVLATLSVASLLTVVALADLEGSRAPALEPTGGSDSAAIGDGTVSQPKASSPPKKSK